MKIKTELAMKNEDRLEFNTIKQMKILVIEAVQKYFDCNYDEYRTRSTSTLFLSHSKEGFERAIKFRDLIVTADVSSIQLMNMIYKYLKTAAGNWKEHSFKTILANKIAPESIKDLKQFRAFLDKNEFKLSTESINTSKPSKK